jgi:gamma-glutamylcyclotransferase (GGCT)/AIG2-like uncharacterized protein YtfP
MTEKVFVYGTLKRGHGNHILLKNSKFLGVSKTRDKYIMYRSGIPFVSKSHSTTSIMGELYEVDELSLNYLDLLEGHPSWYKREMVSVGYLNEQGEFLNTNAWLYFNEDIPHNAQIVKTGIYGSIENSETKSLLHK